MSAPSDDAGIVAAMVRAFDFPRYAASLFVAAAPRRAMLALAAFALDIDRIADQVSQPLPGEVRLQWWIDAIEGNEHGGVAGHPVAAELLRAIDAHDVARGLLVAMVEAHKFDLYDDPMPNVASLAIYCDDTHGSLIGAAAALLSREANAGNAVRAAGRALGLTRMVSRLAHDAAHRRCFLPDDVMAAHGVARGEVLAGHETPALKAARRDLIVRARTELAAVHAALQRWPKAVRPAFLPLATLPHELVVVEKSAPFAVTPPPSRLRVLASQWRMMRS